MGQVTRQGEQTSNAAAMKGIPMKKQNGQLQAPEPTLNTVAASLMFTSNGRPRVMGVLFIASSLYSFGFLLRDSRSFPRFFFLTLGVCIFTLWVFRLRLMAMGENDAADSFKLIPPEEEGLSPVERASSLFDQLEGFFPRPFLCRVMATVGVVTLLAGTVAIALNPHSFGWILIGGGLVAPGLTWLVVTFDRAKAAPGK